MQIQTRHCLAQCLFWFFVSSATVKGNAVTKSFAIHHMSEGQLKLWRNRFVDFRWIRVASHTFSTVLSYKWIEQVRRGRHAFYGICSRPQSPKPKLPACKVKTVAEALMAEYTWNELMKEAHDAGLSTQGPFKTLAYRMARHMHV